jgi:aryl sulfotransferase
MVADSGRWEGFQFRDDDIVISTPAKCGTTWMQMLCALAVFQTPDLPGRLTELSPWLDMQTAPRDEVVGALIAQEHRRFIKTHTPLDGLPYDERVTYICVGRDPRDVAVSWDNHFENINLEVFIGARAAAVGLDDLAGIMPDGPPSRSADPRERFWQWVDDDSPPGAGNSTLRATLEHLATFWDVRQEPNVLLFHYSDLKADLEGEFRRLATALDVQLNDDQAPALVQAATFDSMRGRADRLAPEVKTDGFWNDTDRFFHVGGSGQWEAFIGPGDVERYEARVRALASPELAAWAHAGGQALTPA